MNFISEYSGTIGVAVTVLIIFVSLRGLKGQKEDFQEIRDWLTKEKWQGELTTGSLKSWKQTSTTNNFDYYFIMTFEATIDGKINEHKAAAVVKASDIPKLKKGMPILVKYQNKAAGKMAVVELCPE